MRATGSASPQPEDRALLGKRPADALTVLLVEDEQDTRELLGRALERAGHHAKTASNLESALRCAAGTPDIDVVVTDIVLGNDSRGGLRLLPELRAAGVRAPVVVITAYADVPSVKEALNEGAAYLLEKPFRAAELIEVIDRVRVQGSNAMQAVEQLLARAGLTDKERTVAHYLLEGMSSSEIAELEKNSPRTIRQHVSQIYAKCGVGTRAEFFRLAFAR